MHTEHAGALIDVMQRTFKTMFKLDLTVNDRRIEDSQLAPYEISGIIGVTGKAKGVVVVSFPEDMARKLTAFMLGGEISYVPAQEDTIDCVGEIANIVGGNLLPSLSGSGDVDARISLPSVVIGRHKVVWRRKDIPYDLVLFDSEYGTFAAGINLHEIDKLSERRVDAYRFLLIDDSRMMRRMLQKAVREAKIGECEFTEASDGEVALTELERKGYKFDAIFCDLYMPKMDGLTFLDNLTARNKLGSCPIVVVTGDVTDDRETEALEHGAAECIRKPFTPEDIGQVLKRILKTR